MALVFGFELVIIATLGFVVIFASIKMLFHVFRTIPLQREAKKRYPDSVADQHAYFQEHIYK